MNIPRTDLNVSPLCMGGLTTEDPGLFRWMDRFAAAGGNFFDTANVYGKWAPWFTNFSEQCIGKWLKTRPDRHELIIATKGAHYDLADPARTPRLGMAEIRADLQESLTALGLDRIRLYWLHRDDPSRPIGEIIETMEQLHKEGLVQWYGASNYTAARLAEAREYADAHGSTGFVAVSNQWSLAPNNPGANNNPDPTIVLMGQPEIDFHTATGTPCIPYQSTARGWFAKMAAGQPVDPGVQRAFDNPANRATLARLQQLSAETGHSVQALALTELTHRPFPVLPITGASSDAQMDTLLEALSMLQQGQA